EAEAASKEAEDARQVAVAEKQRAEEQRQRAEEALYAYRLAQTRLALSDNKREEAERQLEKCPPNLRAWEWHHLKRLCKDEKRAAEDTTAKVAALAAKFWGRMTTVRPLSHPPATSLVGF